MVLIKEVIAGELPLEDGIAIYLDYWEYRFKRVICKIRGHIPHYYGDDIYTPLEKWCDRCRENLLTFERPASAQ